MIWLLIMKNKLLISTLLLKNIKPLWPWCTLPELLLLKDSKVMVLLSLKSKLQYTPNSPPTSDLSNQKNKDYPTDIMLSSKYLPVLLKEPKKDQVYKLTKVLLILSSESLMILMKTLPTLLLLKELLKIKDLPLSEN